MRDELRRTEATAPRRCRLRSWEQRWIDRDASLSNRALILRQSSQEISDSQNEPMSHAITPSGRAVNPWWIGLTLTIATFMELLDTSIANVSLPHIAGGLGTSLDEATWVLTSYLVANAVVLPLSAWLSRVFGRKNYYMACVALFTASSFLCGTAPNLGLLIFFRVLQGIAGGGLAPSEQAMLVDTFPPAKRAAAFGLYSMAIVLAPALGPTLGRLDHRQFFLALDFFHQYPGRSPVAFPDQPAGHRSTRIYRRAPADQGLRSESN